MAAAHWSLWLRRNNLTFNSVWELLSTTTDLIKFRSFKWLKAELNFPEEIFKIWQVNPMGASLIHRKSCLIQNMTWWNSECCAFTDGSWEFCSNNSCQAGIRGFIMDRDSNLLFVFSRPSKASSPREAEREAIIYVHKAFASQRVIQGRL